MITILQENYLFFIVCVGFFGLIIGSFLNVVIYRLPIMIKQECEVSCFNLIVPPSHCTKCKTKILWWQNIPIISYVLLGGKCAYCKTNIYWRYFAVELLSCVSSVFVVSEFGVTIQTFALLVLTWTLIAASFIDIDHQLLPDSITLPLIWFGLLLNINQLFTTAEDAIIGACVAYLSLRMIAFVFKLIRKVDGMGRGDCKLFAVFGAWLGWQVLPMVLLISSFVGSVVGIFLILLKKHKASKPMPFGPYLIIAGWFAFFQFFHIPFFNWPC